MRYLSFFALLFCFVSVAQSSVLVLDGDSIIVDGDEIRLIGLDAPEYLQNCFDVNNLEYDCGEEAKKYLRSLVRGRKVSCNKIKKDIYKRWLSECYVDDININLELLRSGWAVLYRSEDEAYVLAEKYAKKNKLGVWQGKFLKPEFHRMLKRKKQEINF